MEDLLSECLDGVEVQDRAAFVDTVCKMCIQPRCERSSKGDLFSTRVSTQMDRLLRAPRADQTSSRYSHLVNFEPAPVHSVIHLPGSRHGWDSAPGGSASPATITPSTQTPTPATVAPFKVGNTPTVAGGIMLDGGNPNPLVPTPARRLDPWGSTPPVSPNGRTIVSPGSKVKV